MVADSKARVSRPGGAPGDRPSGPTRSRTATGPTASVVTGQEHAAPGGKEAHWSSNERVAGLKLRPKNKRVKVMRQVHLRPV